MLFGAYDMADPHLDVVDDVGEDEHRRAIAAYEHEVLDRRVVELDLAPHEIAHDRDARGHTEPQHAMLARTEATVARPAAVAGQALLLGARLDLLGRHVAVVGVSA